MDEASALAARGDAAGAATLVQARAESGDAEALTALAHWRLWGLHGPRDPAAARAFLARAATGEALRLLAHLAANGTGGPADHQAALDTLHRAAALGDPPAAAQLRLLAEPAPAPPTPELLNDSPRVALHRGFAAPAERAHLIALAEPLLRPSNVVDPRSGRPIPHPHRSSHGAQLHPFAEDLPTHAINRRIAAATGTGIACGEPLHILRYTPGQRYTLHLDALPTAANQRVTTALLYLNDDYEGGETSFPELGLRIRGRPGDLLVFANAHADGSPDPRTVHAGEPVTAGAKWLASRWIRARAFDPFAPRGA